MRTKGLMQRFKGNNLGLFCPKNGVNEEKLGKLLGRECD